MDTKGMIATLTSEIDKTVGELVQMYPEFQEFCGPENLESLFEEIIDRDDQDEIWLLVRTIGLAAFWREIARSCEAKVAKAA